MEDSYHTLSVLLSEYVNCIHGCGHCTHHNTNTYTRPTKTSAPFYSFFSKGNSARASAINVFLIFNTSLTRTLGSAVEFRPGGSEPPGAVSGLKPPHHVPLLLPSQSDQIRATEGPAKLLAEPLAYCVLSLLFILNTVLLTLIVQAETFLPGSHCWNL